MTENPEFAEWVASLPEQWQTSLIADNVSTAFYRARRAGWTVEQLHGDAVMTLQRGGVGLVVTRLQSLADNPPKRDRREMPKVRNQQRVTLPECAACGQPYRHGSRSQGNCKSCGEPLALTFHSIPA